MSQNNKDTVIVTSTYYSLESPVDQVRAELSKNTIKKAVQNGYQIIVVDCGSAQELLDDYVSLGAEVHIQTETTMGQSRRKAIKIGFDKKTDFIMWIEPEKEAIIESIPQIVSALVHGADMVIPQRTSVTSYPIFQQHTEQLGNMFWNALTGSNTDIYFGPAAWKNELSHYFLDYTGHYGDKWDSIYIPIMDVLIGKKNVVSVAVDYTHPQSQTEVEGESFQTHLKRLEQLHTLSESFSAHWNTHHH